MSISAKIVLAFFFVASAFAQQWVGARPGMVNYAEGVFYLDQEPLHFPADRFREVGIGKTLRTGDGWVEVQLGPNAFLWLGETGALRMEDPSLTDLQLRVERGSVVVGIHEKAKNHKITIHFGEAAIELTQAGFYQLDSDRARFSVYSGKAKIQKDLNHATIKQGKAVVLDGTLKASKFDKKQMDRLNRIAAQRAPILFPLPKVQQPPAIQTGNIQQGEQQRRQAEEEYRRQNETWKQQNTRPADSQEGHQQPPNIVPPR